MTCFYPLHRFVIGLNSSQEDVAVVKSGKVNSVRIGNSVIDTFQEVPCGKCIGCRLENSRQWANRCMLEAKLYKDNYMLTLTYDDEHLPITSTQDCIDGTVKVNSTVEPKETELFMHRLRKHWERHYDWKKDVDYDENGKIVNVRNMGIRYRLGAEYGDLYGRAHYHILLFNFPVYDLKPMQSSKTGFPQWTSPTLEKVWGKGRISLCELNWETCAYVSRYIMKKQTGEKGREYYEKECKHPEFSRQSLKPGIGYLYYDQHKQSIYETDELFIPNSDGVLLCKPPRYYDKLYDIENPEKMFDIKAKRKEDNEFREKSELSATDLKKDFYTRVKENNLKAKVNKLKRGLV